MATHAIAPELSVRRLLLIRLGRRKYIVVPPLQRRIADVVQSLETHLCQILLIGTTAGANCTAGWSLPRNFNIMGSKASA
jgi:hypothetical protein